MSDPASPSAPTDSPQHRYNPELAAKIELTWQKRWADQGTFEAPNPVGDLSKGFERVEGSPKLFVLDMFPYPSGTGLHVGHPLGFIGTDVFARYHRMAGKNVLHAMGYDAFGLPAEQYAVQTGQHPRVTTEANVANMRRQLGRLGLGYDARRSVSTTDTDFYRWTQWIFLQLFNSWFDPDQQKARPISELEERFDAGTTEMPDGRRWTELSDADKRAALSEHRLAYIADAPVNWCPALGTVLANEEVTNEGRSDRGNFPVYRRPMRQWMLRITAYADRLLDDLDHLDWTDAIKVMQRNWIGRSTGATVRFDVEGIAGKSIEVFTTRPDTLFGATYMVLAPEHPLVDQLTTADWPQDIPGSWKGSLASEAPGAAVAAYRAHAQAMTEIERQTATKVKTGVFTGSYATNPVNDESIPIFIADYVLMGYGTGAIMAVPAHDERDFEFARSFDLPIVEVVAPSGDWYEQQELAPGATAEYWKEAYVGNGHAVRSHNDEISLDGLAVTDAKVLISNWLAGVGKGADNDLRLPLRPVDGL